MNSYQGRLCGDIGLGDPVHDLLKYTELEFDNAEEWFYTDKEYGGLEVTGYGSDLNDEPGQMIMALTVIEESPFDRFSKRLGASVAEHLAMWMGFQGPTLR